MHQLKKFGHGTPGFARKVSNIIWVTHWLGRFLLSIWALINPLLCKVFLLVFVLWIVLFPPSPLWLLS